MNLPNKLTLLRVLLIPVFILCFYIPVRGANLLAAAIFLLAYLTDIFDGLLARKYNII
ncbi:MAG TPA: CDP-alcohol phosphatidyltransferase family protein, partial [Clostridia bacterium]|nr:CDP-alcohol phosphatidyltransferase family protein [Clostridia bacterium]